MSEQELEDLAAQECICCVNAGFTDRGDGICRLCPHEKGFHGWTEREAAAWNAWAGTEPGLEHRLKLREDRLERMKGLDCGPVLEAKATQHVNEIREQLGRPLLPVPEVPDGSDA